MAGGPGPIFSVLLGASTTQFADCGPAPARALTEGLFESLRRMAGPVLGRGCCVSSRSGGGVPQEMAAQAGEFVVKGCYVPESPGRGPFILSFR